MTADRPFSYEHFQRIRRPFELGFWVGLYLLNALINSVTSQVDHPGLPAWQPWVWEWSSALAMLVLIPAVLAALRRWPLSAERWRRNLPWHLGASVAFSLAHVAVMVALRKLAYLGAGEHYRFGPWTEHGLGYEYLKDLRTYVGIIAVVALYRLWLLRLQGEARLLAEPDEGAPVEPVERPERFLVRKLGKEFLLNAREIESLQASGNYVNLRVRGRDYPLRSTMAGIEARLDPARFVRVHRGYIVNLDYLAEIEPLETGDARLTLRDGARLPCSRRYRALLRERFGEIPAAAVAQNGRIVPP